ncbi:MAG TPA: hypothetical protein VN986_03480 [Actinomycetota bacterium]|nr:hypothetical protein [Actinomycetota bacterium]
MILRHSAAQRWLLLLACAVVIASAGAAAPASAAADPCTSTQTSQLDVSITVWQPGPDTSPADAHRCTPPSGSPLTGSWNIRLDALSLSSLQSFSVSIVPADPSIPALPPGATTSRTYPLVVLGNGKIGDTIEMPWDTGSMRYNGTYQISATAVSMLNSTAHAVVGDLLINNPPAQPPGASATLDGTVPVLNWTANSEPDLTGYRILRSTSGGAYAPVGTSPGNSFRDTKAPQGKPLKYEVVAVRRSPVDANGIASAASLPTGAVVSAPPVTPTVVAPAPVTRGTTGSSSNNAQAQDPSSTFAPTLPFAQAVPTSTATLPDAPAPTTAHAALPAEGGGYAKTTLAHKLPYLATAIFVILVAFLIFQYARRLQKGDA